MRARALRPAHAALDGRHERAHLTTSISMPAIELE
jgi:hypothetical protein